mmetsp:Transcript_30649/g.56006  ORF Transcript_30649/g.56006 Transcript_30649/m.56006 type:complete len:418 (-) Transcript_30649:150-1403(-)
MQDLGALEERLAGPLLALGGVFASAALAASCASRAKKADTPTRDVVAKEEAQPLTAKEEGEAADQEKADQKEAPPKAQAIALIWQVLIVTAFVCCGAAQALAVSAARTEAGELPFDQGAAVACSESLKLAVALGLLLGSDRSALRCPPPSGWLWEAMDLTVVAGFFALQNELNYITIAYLGAVLFVLLGNSLKIVFTVFFMWLLLRKQFAPLQWIAVMLLVVSATVSQAPQIIGEETAGFSWRLVMGLGVMLVLTTSAGFAAVRNELIFKREREDRMPFMLQNAVMYVWGIGFNLSSWAFFGKHSFLEGFTPVVWVSVVCASCMGLMVAMMLKYLDNVVRCFSGVGQVLFTVLASRLLPAHLHEGNFDVFYLASLVTLAVALVLYQGHSNKRLPLLLFSALLASLVIGLTCMWLDSH